jgi:DNA-binding response OmpR family regulator
VIFVTDLSGLRRIFVVEDEPLIAVLIEDMLQELGYEVACSASRFNEALRFAQTLQVEAAILDVNIHGQDSFPIAHVLRTRGVPFLFATGYGDASIPDNFKTCPTIRKPFDLKTLEKTLRGIFRTSGDTTGRAAQQETGMGSLIQ